LALSNGTGRDGLENRNAPKAGWCWVGNRHTWLGFATAAIRIPLPATRALQPALATKAALCSRPWWPRPAELVVLAGQRIAKGWSRRPDRLLAIRPL